jgi:hypothetical protein
MTYVFCYSTKTIDLWRYLLLIGIKSVICTSYKKKHEICHVNPDPSLEEAKYGGGVKTLSGSQPSDYFNIFGIKSVICTS